MCTLKSCKGMGAILVHRRVWVVVRNVAGVVANLRLRQRTHSRAHAQVAHMRMVVQCAAWLLLLDAAAVTCGLGAQQQAKAMQMATTGNVATTSRRTLRKHAVCGTCASIVPEPWKK